MKKAFLFLSAVMILTMLMSVFVCADPLYPPVELRFDGDEDAVGIKSTSYGSTMTGEVENGRLVLDAKAGDGNNVSFVLNENERFNLADYPYVKVKFRNSHSSRGTQLYLVTNIPDAQETFTHRYYCDVTNTAQSADKFTIILKAASQLSKLSSEYPTPDANNPVVVSEVRFDAIRGSQEDGICELEYIAFFHALEEAQAYGISDAELIRALEGVQWMYNKANITTQTQLEEKLEEEVSEALEATSLSGLTADVAVTEYLPGEAGEEGSFTFTVTTSATKSVPSVNTYSGYLFPVGVTGKATVISDREAVEKGGATFKLTANVMGVASPTAYKWYFTLTDSNDVQGATLMATTAVAEYGEVVCLDDSCDEFYCFVAVENDEGTTVSEPLKITAFEPQAVVLDFHDKDEIAKWKSSSMKKDSETDKLPQMTDEDGTVFMRAEAAAYSAGAQLIRTFAENEQISLESHPYLVVKMRRSYGGGNDFYLQTTYYRENPDKQYRWHPSMYVSDSSIASTANEWDISIIDMAEYQKTYTVSTGPNSVKASQPWKGYLYEFMSQRALYEGDTTDIEFIAFAPDMKSAVGVLRSYVLSALEENPISLRQDVFDNGTYAKNIEDIIKSHTSKYKLSAENITVTDIVNATLTDNGSFKYSVKLSYSQDLSEVYNGTGVIRSAAAEVSAQKTEVIIGENAVLSVEAEGITPTSYSWLHNTENTLEGAVAVGCEKELSYQIGGLGENYFFVKIKGTTNGTNEVEITSDAFVVTGVAPKEPIIWRFNNQDMIDLWNVGKNYNVANGQITLSELRNGVMYTAFSTGDGSATAGLVDDHYYRTAGIGGKMPEEYQFWLQAYPYFKIKYRSTAGTSGAQIYLWTKGASDNPNFSVSGGASGEWHTASVDLSDKGMASGRLENFGLWIWNNMSAGYSEIEYIAFFPASQAGKKAWEDFDSQNPNEQCSSDADLPGYAEMAAALASAKAALKEPIHSATTQVLALSEVEEAVETALADVDYDSCDISLDAQLGNGYRFKVSVVSGDKPECRTVATEYILVRNQSPTPIIWKFNNPAFAQKWHPNGSVMISYGEEGDQGYLDVNSTMAVDNCNIAWLNIPEENRFELSEYPYIAIRYRSTNGGGMQLYPSTTTSANGDASGSFYRGFLMSSTTGQWVKIVRTLDSGEGKWEGILDYLRVDFMRSSQVKKDIDIDYIAFFATEAEAENYDGGVLGDKTKTEAEIEKIDKELLNVAYKDVNDEAAAKAKIEEILAAIEMSDDVAVNVDTTEYIPTDYDGEDGMVGKFGYRVSLMNGPLGASAISILKGALPLAPKAQLGVLGVQMRKYVSDNIPQGLRFGTRLNKSVIEDDDVKNVAFGTLIIPERLIPDGTELTFETQGALDAKGKNIFLDEGDSIIYTGVLTGIPESEYDTPIAARSYIKYTFMDEDYVVYSNDTKVRSVNMILGLEYDGYDEELDLTGKQEYDRETWMVPFWQGDTVYHELFWPVMPEDAEETDDLVIDLMYPVSDVIIVKNGTHTQDFAEYKDYYINADGQLVIPYGSAIKRTPFNFYISDNNIDGLHGMDVDSSKTELDKSNGKYDGKKLYWTEGSIIQTNYQYSITYRHDKQWTGMLPEEQYDENAFPITRQKLADKEKFTIAFYGDSITAGGNNTGNYGTSPYTPKWSEMMVQSLEEIYGYTDNSITIENRAVAGKTSTWGATDEGNDPEFAKKRFSDTNPTLFVLAFGMNDEYTGTTAFKSNIISIVNQILEINPDCEFLLVSNSMPNPLWGTVANRGQYETVLEEVVDELSEEGVSIDCARLQSMHKYLLGIKEYRDMTGNNVNHQNDMLARLYAQTCLAYITDRYITD